MQDLVAAASAAVFTVAVAAWALGALVRLVVDGHALAVALRLAAAWLLGLDLVDGDDGPPPVAPGPQERATTTVSYEWRSGDGSGAGL